MTFATGLVRAVLRLYPKAFRSRFGSEMVATYLDQRDAKNRSALRHAGSTILDLIISLPGAWRDERRRRFAQPVLLPPRPASMDRFATDLRRVIRSLAKQPGFVAVSVATLVLGIGANTAVFSVLDSVVLSPLPYDRPDGLVRLYSGHRERPEDRGYLTGMDALDLRAETAALEAVGVLFTYRETGADLSPPGEAPRRIRVVQVSADYFRALGATPALGRTFGREEELGGTSSVILSHELWRELSNGDPTVIGRTIDFDGRKREVIGVMRPGFRDLAGPDVAAWIPANLAPGGSNNRNNHYLSAVARLTPGVSLAEAQARLDVMTKRLAPEYGRNGASRVIRAVPLLDDEVGNSRGSLVVLMGAAGLVLLIACLNVANLFLARSLGQAREVAVRAALGANRTRLVAERLGESLLVAVAGGAIGSAVAYWGVRLLLAVSPESLARAEEVGFDPRLLGFALATTIATGLLFGAWPAWRASRVDPVETLHEGSRGNTAGRGARRVSDLLVSGQVAVAVVLLVGAGILIRSFVALQRADLGFPTDHLATFEVNLPDARYADPAARAQFHRTFLDQLRTLGGVTTAGAVSWLPANGVYHQWAFGYLEADGSRKWIQAQYRVVEGDYFTTLRLPILAGRAFAAEERDSTLLTVISEDLARQAYGGRDPIGQPFEGGDRNARIIGVVANAAQEAAGGHGPQVYLSHGQFAADRNWSLTYLVRTVDAPLGAIPLAKQALAKIDPALVLFQPRTLDEVVAGHRARERFTMLLMATFAGVALSLAAIGLYGVLSYAVSIRGHEIGVRMALGARPGQVQAAVIRHGVLIALGGMMVGGLGALAAGRMIGSAVVDAKGYDPIVLLGVLGVLWSVVLVAGYLPARRATRIDPLEAFRRG